MATTTFSGVFKRTGKGMPDQNVTYNGSVVTTKGPFFSIDLEVNKNGVATKLVKDKIDATQLQTDPDFMLFMQKLTSKRKVKAAKTKKMKRGKRL
jgi:hypothetical protein